ncbi:MAG: hypothetical protein LC130_04085, partial [Bryobacterales bacterium]|nr:hypothetical protein [Bryobacterales bacterium]
MGHAALLASNDLQRNYRNPHIELFRDWEQEAWVRYAGEVYREVDCAGGRSCGTLMSNRNVWGDWNKPAPDAWFNSWFQTLRTAYGWYLYGRRTQDASVQRKAESILNLALSSPQKNGVFPTIYLVDEKRWIPEDGWAGFSDSYHTFCMSWNSWWMLQWAKDLTPGRRSQIIGFARPYAGFLVKHQLSSGAIPSWYDAELNPRAEFREFNAETAGSALFLLELGEQTGDRSFIQAGTRAMEFVTREVRPRQRWYDFETFKSCARKSFDFYDRWTAQYPANNLSTIQASMAYLKLYRITKEARWLQLGVEAVDYLLLTQQVWNNPAFSPKLLGGFTTQNTDAEWSDARQCYAATLLLDYYRETGTAEYLERAIAAARSTFAVAPWENWAHTGHIDDRGAMTGIHWGTGSAMASVEIMAPFLGDAFIAVDRKHGAGFNGCALSRLKVEGDTIAFQVEALPRLKSLRVRFAGVDPKRRYRLAANDQAPVTIEGTTLATDGYLLKLPPGK